MHCQALPSIAKHCARLWAGQSPASFALVGRDEFRLKRVADDLSVRAPEADIQVIACDLLDPVAIQAVVTRLTDQRQIDIVLIAHGSLSDQAHCQGNIADTYQQLLVNGVSPVVFAEGFAQRMEAANHGVIAVIGSVAGDRGRQSNYIYGSAKGLIERYVEGMQHRFHPSSVRALLIKPGPTDTPMTSHVKEKGAKMASPEQVAKDIVKAVDGNQCVVYTPKIWQVIMFVIKCLPRAIFNRLKI